MKQSGGWWLPDNDEHFTGYTDLSLYQQVAFDAALRRVPRDRRRLAVDVGAHVGTWTLRLAKLFAEVVAIEADPNNHACLMRNLSERGIGNVEIVRAAAGAAEGVGHVRRVCPTNSGDCAVDTGPGDGTAPAVGIVRLDDLLAPRPAVDFLKLDLQGGELAALQGAEATLARHQPVVIAEFFKQLGPDKDVLALLAAHGLHPVERIRGDLIYAPTGGKKEAAA